MLNYIWKLKRVYTKEEVSKKPETEWIVYEKKFLYVVQEGESINIQVDKDFTIESAKLEIWKIYNFPVKIYNNYWIKNDKAYSILNYALSKEEKIIEVSNKNF